MHEQEIGWQKPTAFLGFGHEIAHITRAADRDIGVAGDKIDGFLCNVELPFDCRNVRAGENPPRSFGSNGKAAKRREAIENRRELEFGKNCRIVKIGHGAVLRLQTMNQNRRLSAWKPWRDQSSEMRRQQHFGKGNRRASDDHARRRAPNIIDDFYSPGQNDSAQLVQELAVRFSSAAHTAPLTNSRITRTDANSVPGSIQR
jgi:hypothetical protein